MGAFLSLGGGGSTRISTPFSELCPEFYRDGRCIVVMLCNAIYVLVLLV